jgi:SAM-dependent methyltransferase
MSQNFNLYSRYYDLLYAEKDYEQEVRFVERQIQTYSPGAKSLLELGSGTGNHATYFADSGYDVTGIERSAEMVGISQSKNIRKFTAVNADMTGFNVEGRFDAAVSLFHSLCYITSNESLLDCFSTVYRHLKPGGIFCFDFWYGPAVLNDLPATRVRKVANGNIQLTRIAQTELLSQENVAVVNYELIVRDQSSGVTQNFFEQHPMRYLSVPELDLLCRQTGFTILKCESYLDSLALNLDTWNGFCVIKRID